jgi:hypothetical protein
MLMIAALTNLSGCADVRFASPGTQGADASPQTALAESSVVALRPDGGVVPLYPAQWSRTPSGDLIEGNYPRGAPGARLACGAASDRTLRDCRILSVAPAGAGFEASFLRLTREYRLSEASPPPDRIDQVRLTLELWSGIGDAPCNPPWCHSVPPPPPPPTSSSDGELSEPKPQGSRRR